ncbi:MAG: hypothetical protein ACI9K5_003772 [Gammaproteobacteria bacterium]|jgi:hypothetical protein
MANGLPYNGWAEPVRNGRDNHYYHARNKSVLKQTDSCLACGHDFGDAPVPYHAEEYGPTLEDYWASCEPLCHRCHAMVHARFLTPNLWKQFLAQLASGSLDEGIYPQSTQVAALLSKFKNRKDIDFVPMPTKGDPYLLSLPMEDYAGADKVATLRVADQVTGEHVEVPDWTIYGEDLAGLNETERDTLRSRGVRLDEFLSGSISIPRSSNGKLRYQRLYV